MRRTALVVAAGLLWPASTFSQDGQISFTFMDGNQLYDWRYYTLQTCPPYLGPHPSHLDRSYRQGQSAMRNASVTFACGTQQGTTGNHTLATSLYSRRMVHGPPEGPAASAVTEA